MAAREPIRATRAIRAIDPEARVIALTEGDDYRALSLCLAAGAKGCLRKDSATIRLVPLMVALQRAPSVGSRATAADAPGGSASRAEETTFNRRRAKIVLSYLLRARVCAPVLALAVGATLAGCGGGGSSGSNDKAATGPVVKPRSVNARLGEYKIRLDHADAPNGTVTFTIRQRRRGPARVRRARDRHAADGLPVKKNEARAEGGGTRVVDEAEDIDAGKTVKLAVELKRGNYVVICNLPGHYLGGMRAAFRVE